MRILISGGGLGGLALAHGLLRGGHDVTVFERSPEGSSPGFRLNINGDGGNALEKLLAPDLYRLYQATSRSNSRIAQATMLDARLRLLGSTPHIGPPNEGPMPHTAVHRSTLRQILSTGLDDLIEHGAVVGYEERGDRVALKLDGGKRVEGDLIVAADGINSAIRRQLLPELEIIEDGFVGVFARTPLTKADIDRLPGEFFDGVAIVLGPLFMDGGIIALGPFEPRQNIVDAVAEHAPRARLDPVNPYMMLWVGIAPEISEFCGIDPAAADGGQLKQLAEAATERFDPHITSLVANAGDWYLSPMRRLTLAKPWPPSRVTLLGDAIHAMPPTIGAGANLALADAALLTGFLGDAGTKTEPVAAVGHYEEAMRAYDWPIAERAADPRVLRSGIGPIGILRLIQQVGARRIARELRAA